MTNGMEKCVIYTSSKNDLRIYIYIRDNIGNNTIILIYYLYHRYTGAELFCGYGGYCC